jgi:hypothetical protein
MNVDLVVSSMPTLGGPLQTRQAAVYSTNSDTGLAEGETTLNWQQDLGVTEWIGGQPSESILTGWTYASPELGHCDQSP